MPDTYLILGFGSMGRRHARHLRSLRPGVRIITADPDSPFIVDYTDWRTALDEHPDARGVIVASPHEWHPAQMYALSRLGIPFLIEKPLGRANQYPQADAAAFAARQLPCAVGFQYRYNHAVQAARDTWRARGDLAFYARDNLLDRYGPTCPETMGSHALDLACWLLGAPQDADLHHDGGRALTGWVAHERGVSRYNQRMDTPSGRESIVYSGAARWELPADETAYRKQLGAWLEWIETGNRDERLATLADGLVVQRLLEGVRA